MSSHSRGDQEGVASMSRWVVSEYEEEEDVIR